MALICFLCLCAWSASFVKSGTCHRVRENVGVEKIGGRTSDPLIKSSGRHHEGRRSHGRQPYLPSDATAQLSDKNVRANIRKGI